MRAIAGNGLFTADVGNHDWEVAHRVLVTSFGPFQIRSMFDDLFDVASQLIMKWARHPNEKILASDDFTVCLPPPRSAARAELGETGS